MLSDERVEVSHLGDAGLPTVVQPREPGVDLAAWCAAHGAAIDACLSESGAVLFRNFDLPQPRDFERAANAVCGELFADYGDLPKHAEGERIYHSTPYPPDQMILWHSESSHLPSWPMRINFYCVTPATTGGATPIVDTRELMRAIDPGVVAKFRHDGLLYVRNFIAGIEPGWQQFFHTPERAVVEAACRAAGSEFAWRSDGGLRLRQRSQGVARHPVSGAEVFFNQVQLHHIACVDEATREGLRALVDDDDLPRNVTYGDGSPSPDDVVTHIVAVCERTSVRFTWQRGDMITLDNMLVAHARDTFSGPRAIAVAMGRMTLAGAPAV